MKLNDYLKKNTACALAARVGVSTAAMSYYANGLRSPSIDNCKKIEFATGGLVRCEDLRPELNWGYIRSQASVKTPVLHTHVRPASQKSN